MIYASSVNNKYLETTEKYMCIYEFVWLEADSITEVQVVLSELFLLYALLQ